MKKRAAYLFASFALAFVLVAPISGLQAEAAAKAVNEETETRYINGDGVRLSCPEQPPFLGG